MKTGGPNIDELLDVALRRYATAEPRPGLEGRVRARLRAAEPRTQPAWWWVVPGVVALALVVTIAYLRSPTSDPILIPLARTVGPPPAIALVRSHGLTTEVVHHGLANRRPWSTHEVASVSAAPKLDQFPSPMPLTEQEQMLAGYVQQFHREAALMARAQTKLLKEENRDRARFAGVGEMSQDAFEDQP